MCFDSSFLITRPGQLATEGVKSKGKGKAAKQPTNTVSRQNSVTHNSRHLKAVAKVCGKIGRRDLQANALARYSKVHAALLNINKPVAANASLRGKRGLGVAPGVFRVRLDISEKAKRIQKKHEAVSCMRYSFCVRATRLSIIPRALLFCRRVDVLPARIRALL